jgi:hypothetical protein
MSTATAWRTTAAQAVLLGHCDARDTNLERLKRQRANQVLGIVPAPINNNHKQLTQNQIRQCLRNVRGRLQGNDLVLGLRLVVVRGLGRVLED